MILKRTVAKRNDGVFELPKTLLRIELHDPIIKLLPIGRRSPISISRQQKHHSRIWIQKFFRIEVSDVDDVCEVLVVLEELLELIGDGLGGAGCGTVDEVYSAAALHCWGGTIATSHLFLIFLVLIKIYGFYLKYGHLVWSLPLGTSPLHPTGIFSPLNNS